MLPDLESTTTTAIDLVQLAPLMKLTRGIPGVVVGLIDGPVALDHPDLSETAWRTISKVGSASCGQKSSFVCQHGTFVAGILAAKRSSTAPALCPGCTFLVRPIFTAVPDSVKPLPGATPDDPAKAITDCIEAGAQILNISAAIVRPSTLAERSLKEALQLAAHRGLLVVAAAGNQGLVGATSITGSRWVIPVVASDLHGRPLNESNIGSSIGRRGLLAPGNRITSLSTTGGILISSGTSAAAPFVTGAIALLWSLFPKTTGAQIKQALMYLTGGRRTTIVPPLLNAWASYQFLARLLR
jgi:subtilisin family serine protease